MMQKLHRRPARCAAIENYFGNRKLFWKPKTISETALNLKLSLNLARAVARCAGCALARAVARVCALAPPSGSCRAWQAPPPVLCLCPVSRYPPVYWHRPAHWLVPPSLALTVPRPVSLSLISLYYTIPSILSTLLLLAPACDGAPVEAPACPRIEAPGFCLRSFVWKAPRLCSGGRWRLFPATLAKAARGFKEEIREAGSIEDLLVAEARAGAAYFMRWRGFELRFKDHEATPQHWQTFAARAAGLIKGRGGTSKARHAATPIGAMPPC